MIVENAPAVSELVVVPGYELDEVVVERDTSLGIEGGRSGVSDEVAGDNLVLCGYI